MGKILYCLLFCIPCTLFAQKQVIEQLRAELPRYGGDSVRYADALNRLSLLYLPQQLDSSFHYARAGHALSLRLRYHKGIADANMNLGACFTFFYNNKLPYRFYREGLQRYQLLGDSAGICKALYSIGTYYHSQRRNDLAVPYMNDAMAIGSRLLHDSAWAPMLANYYMVFESDSTRLDSIQWALGKAREIAGRYHDERVLTYTGFFLANERLRKGEVNAAMQDLLQLASRAGEDGFVYLTLYAYAQLDGYASYYHLPDTLLYRQKMMEAAMQGGYKQLLVRPAIWLYKYYRAQGAAAASPYADALSEIAEHQDDMRRQGGENYMEEFLQEQERKAQGLNSALQQQNQIRESLETRNRNMLMSFVIVCCFLVIGLIVANYFLFRSTRRNEGRLKELNRIVSEQNRHLKHHDDFKNKLLSILAHDFRLPLGHIINASQLFAREDIKDEEMRDISSSIASMATETLHLFENVLRWVKSQLAGFEYQPKPYLLRDLWVEVQEPMAEDIRDKALVLELNIPADLEVQADKEMLQFVNRNLLHNAVKFTSRGGRIMIEGYVENDRVVVTVTNEGGGISAVDIPYVFDYKIVGRYARETGRGAGIALIICKDFVERMGGIISVRSDGTNFTTFEYML